MSKSLRPIIAALVACALVLSMTAPVFAYNSVPGGNANVTPILDSNSRSLNGATWTPYASWEKTRLEFHPGDKKYATQRLYPKPDGATLPSMGWNSWNAFFNRISASIIAGVADAYIERGLDKVGYKYLVIDDGCYASGTSVIPSTSTTYGTSFAAFAYNGFTGFRAMGEYVHSKGLKFGMYNDSGGSTCAGQPGAYPSAGGREDPFAAQFVSFGIDLLKYDYCGNPLNAVYNITGPEVQRMEITSTPGNPSFNWTTNWAAGAPSGVTYIGGASRNSNGYLSGLGVSSTTTFYATNTLSGSALITVTGVPEYGTYNIGITRRNSGGTSNSGGRYLMVDVNGERVYEALTSNTTAFPSSPNTNITVELKAGTNIISIYNTKSQDTGLYCFTSIRDAFQKAPTVVEGRPGQNVSLKTCEWANTASWQWADMIGESNRLYADIFGNWNPMGTWGYVRNEYDRAIYLTTNDYARLGGVWPDGDMLVVALGQYTTARNPSVSWSIGQNRQHFNTYCIINSPLLLGFDLRDDALWNNIRVNDDNYIINNRNVIWLSQDPYGVAGRRIKMTSGTPANYSTSARGDYIAKPLSNGDVAVQFTNWNASGSVTPSLNVNEVVSGIGHLILNSEAFTASETNPLYALNLDTGATFTITSNTQNIFPAAVPYYDAATFRLSRRPFVEGFNANTYMGVGISFDQIDFVGGEIQVGTSNGAPNGTPVMYRNRVIGLATVSNNTGADINAAIKLDMYNAKGELVWAKTGPSRKIENGYLVPWEYKEELPDIVVGYKMTATLINTDTGLPFDSNVCPSYTRYAATPEPNSVKLEYAGFERTFKTANENPTSATATLSSKDTELVGSNPVTVTGTVYNDTDDDMDVVLLTALYNADGSVADYKFSNAVSVLPEDNISFTDKFFLPQDVAGKYVRSFLLDADTFEEIPTPAASLPAGAGTGNPTAAGIASDVGIIMQRSAVFGIGLFKNNTAATVSPLVVFAHYDERGALVKVEFSDAEDVLPGAIGVLSSQKYDLADGTAGQTVRAFLWDSKTYTPLAREAVERVNKAPPANKSALLTLVQQAETLTLSDYSLVTGGAVADALSVAKALIADPDAIQADVNAAENDLRAAIDALVASPRTILGQVIASAKDTDFGRYNLLTGDKLNTAIAAAEAVYSEAASTEGDCNAAIASVNAAVAALVAAPGGHVKVGNSSPYGTNDPYIEAEIYGGGNPYSGTAIQYIRLFDRNLTTFMDTATAAEGFGGINMGNGNAISLSKVRVYPRQGTYSNRINTCTIRGSNGVTGGGTGGDTLISFTNLIPSNDSSGNWYERECTITDEYQYIWFQAGASSFGNAGEIEFYTFINVSDKSLLNDRIAFAQGLTAADFSTPALWTALQNALSAAVTVAANDSATQDQINTATSALKAAIAG